MAWSSQWAAAAAATAASSMLWSRSRVAAWWSPSASAACGLGAARVSETLEHLVGLAGVVAVLGGSLAVERQIEGVLVARGGGPGVGRPGRIDGRGLVAGHSVEGGKDASPSKLVAAVQLDDRSSSSSSDPDASVNGELLSSR